MKNFLKINKHLGAERILLLFTFFSLIYTSYILFFGKNNIFKYIEKERTKKTLQEEIIKLQKENELLRKEISFLRRDKFYIEKKAREDLGLVKEGDEIFIIIPKKRKVQEQEDRWIDKVIKKYQEFILRQ
ncbi:MAG: septum formation initiator family protein [Aquificae bacterium]|nr:septum formation initiator family protein [Aquificota bacterium]